MERHEWHITDGEESHQYWRANHHGGRWTIMMKPDRDADWETIKKPENEHWEMLRDVLWRKYQRKRCPWKMIAKIDKILGRPNEGPQP
ncbi:MAG: hypothetical protein ACSHYF_09040 [Verrucomicrobiaceae bacterium]